MNRRKRKASVRILKLLFIVVFCLIIGLLAYRFLPSLLQHYQKSSKSQNSLSQPLISSLPETQTITLYLLKNENIWEPRNFSLSLSNRSTGERIRRLFEELKNQQKNPSLFPRDLELKDVYLSATHIYLDFDSSLTKIQGYDEEKMFVTAIVYNVLKNVSLTYESIRILVEGKEYEGYHLNFKRSFKIEDVDRWW